MDKLTASFAYYAQDQSKRWSTRELLEADFPAPRWAAVNLVPEGLIILAGRPKVGKSWLALQLAKSVGLATSFLGHPVDKGRVLYLALEDSLRRMQERMERQHYIEEVEVDVQITWPALDQGGIEKLEETIRDEGYKLVIIDTLSRALDQADQNESVEMTRVLGGLQRVALDARITILLVDHHRKNNITGSADPIDDIMGSTAKGAAVDASLGLYRHGDQNILMTRGRDLKETELRLQWDNDCFQWINNGTVDVRPSRVFDNRVLEAIKESNEQQPTTTTYLAQRLNEPRSNVSRSLKVLESEGLIGKGPKQGREQPYHIAKTNDLIIDNGYHSEGGQDHDNNDNDDNNENM